MAHFYVNFSFLRIAGLTSVRALLADYLFQVLFKLEQTQTLSNPRQTSVCALLADNLFQVLLSKHKLSATQEKTHIPNSQFPRKFINCHVKTAKNIYENCVQIKDDEKFRQKQ